MLLPNVSNLLSSQPGLTHLTMAEMGGMFVFDRNSTAIAVYQVPHTSYVVVVNAAGKVVYAGVGPDQNLDAAP